MIWLMTHLKRLAVVFAFVGASLSPAQAIEPGEAEALAQEIISEMLVFIDSDRPLTEKIEEFRLLINVRADMPAIARFSLGIAWREASEAERDAYLDVFDDYIATKYGRQFTRFDGQVMTVTGSLDAGRRGTVVLTEFDQNDGSEPVRVDWLFNDRSGSARIVDIVVEGVSLLSSERQEIAARLDEVGGDIDRLVELLPELVQLEG
ncbi:MAG: ABC transporter substrate-binding protein [Pseudomonadota bacterium]